MGVIQVKFDSTLQQSEIKIPLTSSSQEEAGDTYTPNKTLVQQTLVYGIHAPLIMINSIVVDFTDVIDFELKCIDVTPTVSMTVRDRYKLSAIIDTPSIDNELRVQVLPKFDNKYKKINLTFYITNIRFNGDYIFIKGEYKLPILTSSNIKSFGEISTYGLFQTIATEIGLGFATNIEENENDKRFVYCDYKPYNELLKNEIQRSGVDLQICDYWVDWWNNLVLADIYERYNATDSDEDMQIWISGKNGEIEEGGQVEPQQAVATLHNHPSMQASELYVKDYHISNKPGLQMYKGTDHIYSTYECPKLEYMDYLIQDGDTQKDVFVRHEYLGEVYSEYNYLLAGKKRESFLQKMNTNETIEIELITPLLGMMRGNRVNFLWYINNSKVESVQHILGENGQPINTELEMNIPFQTNEPDNTDGNFMLDRTISGQYLILGCKMRFINMRWSYSLILGRPTIMKPKLINEDT